MSETRSRLHTDNVDGKSYTATYVKQSDGTWKGTAKVGNRKFTVSDESLDMALRKMEEAVNSR